jgi:prefoldin subunit 5
MTVKQWLKKRIRKLTKELKSAKNNLRKLNKKDGEG